MSVLPDNSWVFYRLSARSLVAGVCPAPLTAARDGRVVVGEGTDGWLRVRGHRPFAPVERARRARGQGHRAGAALAACGGALVLARS